MAFEVATPLPARGSAVALREQLLDHLMRTKPSVGSRFLSDLELSKIARVSRPTVRRALDDLEREGWIERRPGIGTFIGPRASVRAPVRRTVSTPVGTTARLALMIHTLGDYGRDWYASGVVTGIDDEAERSLVSLELLGNRDGDLQSISRRLQQSRPDVLALVAPAIAHTLIIGEARRLQIPCIGTGTLLASMGIPAVCEDGYDGARRAVRHLVEHGHHRIGLVAQQAARPWVFQRRQGYMDGHVDMGLEADEGMVCWLNEADDIARTYSLERFLERRRPTALLFSNWGVVAPLGALIKAGKLVVPRDLSVIAFDQNPNLNLWLGVKPTVVALPLAEMGGALARMAHELAGGKTVGPMIELGCKLISGESVSRI